jgi:hypothetical protein
MVGFVGPNGAGKTTAMRIGAACCDPTPERCDGSAGRSTPRRGAGSATGGAGALSEDAGPRSTRLPRTATRAPARGRPREGRCDGRGARRGRARPRPRRVALARQPAAGSSSPRRSSTARTCWSWTSPSRAWTRWGSTSCPGCSAARPTPASRSRQTTMTPLTILIVASFFIGISGTSSPDSTLAVVASLLPFSSPLVMPTRIALRRRGVGGGRGLDRDLGRGDGSADPARTKIHSRALLRGGRVRIRQVLRGREA